MPSSDRHSERGFTLAGLLMILTVIAVFVAYTVPPMWSQIMKREREIQTIWVMKQYARAIQEFQRKQGVFPVSLDQLAEQKEPRVLRRLYPNPLTGKVDWILVPIGTQTPAGRPDVDPRIGVPGITQPIPGQGVGAPGTPGGGPDQIGPFIGVRPPVTGESFLTLNGANRYEQWIYTINELQKEFSAQTPQAGPQQPNPQTPPTSTRP